MRTLLTLLALLAPLSSIAAPLFVPLGISETESARLTPDGTAVIGVRRVDGKEQFFRWTREGGFAELGELGPNAWVTDVSSDGAVVVGSRPSQSGPSQAFVWTAATGAVVVGSNLGVSAVSADGSVLIGTNPGVGAFRWTEADGMVGLEGGAYATDVSADGRTIVGATAMICCDPHAAYWDIELDLTILPIPWNHAYSHPMAVSADGTTIVGWSGQLESESPFRWTPSGGTELLGAASGWGIANGVSADGSVIVGTGGFPFDPAAFVWDAHGFRFLGDELVARGTDLAGWKLISARSISDDGRVILGLGANPNGNREMWIAIIPEPSTAFLAALGLVALARKPLLGSGGSSSHQQSHHSGSDGRE